MSTPKKFSFKDAAAKIRALFEDTPAAADVVAVDAEKDYTTDSGTKLKIDKLEAGGQVYLEDGTTAVTSGFTLADGTTVEVDENGIITSVSVPGAAPVAAVTPDITAMVDTKMAELEQKLTAQFTALTALLETEKSERAKQSTKFADAMAQTLTIIEKFADEPAADPVQAPANTPPAESKRERGARLLMAAQESAKNK